MKKNECNLPRTYGNEMKIHSSDNFAFVDCNGVIVFIIFLLFLYLAILSRFIGVWFEIRYLIIQITIHVLRKFTIDLF